MLFESREQKTERIYQELKQGKKVSRWQVMPVRFDLLKKAKSEGNKDILEELKFLIEEAKASL
jgi:hypothetical protein